MKKSLPEIPMTSYVKQEKWPGVDRKLDQWKLLVCRDGGLQLPLPCRRGLGVDHDQRWLQLCTNKQTHTHALADAAAFPSTERPTPGQGRKLPFNLGEETQVRLEALWFSEKALDTVGDLFIQQRPARR